MPIRGESRQRPVCCSPKIAACARRSPLKLELRGITKRFGDAGRQRPHRPDRRAGRDPRPARRERRRQVHADERAVRPAPARRGRDPRRRRGRHASSSPGDAIAAGIGMVHQHFMLVAVFTVAENIDARRRATRGGGSACSTWTAARAHRCVEVSERYGLAVDPDAVVEDLPVGVQQRVEIVKALTREATCSSSTSRPRCSPRRRSTSCSRSCAR